MRTVITGVTMSIIYCTALLATVEAQSIPSWKITDVKNYIDRSDSVIVVNFWATFCKPCVEEIPYLESIVEKYKDQKVNLLLVSLDLPSFYPDKIKAFLQKNKYSSQIAWLDENNADYFCPAIDKSWSGGIPATYIVNSKKGYRKFIEEQMTPGQFEQELKKALSP